MYLLDTHYLLWSLYEPEKLSKKAIELLEDSNNVIFFSSASIFEIVIKESIGKIKVEDNITNTLIEAGFLELPITAKHAENLKSIPLLHKDPFDRILLSQAVIESLTLITKDNHLQQYKNYYKNIVNL